MTGITQITKTGPRTYAPETSVTGGQLVEGTDTGKIKTATAKTKRHLGVALNDASAPGAPVSTTANGRTTSTLILVPTETAVAYAPQEVPVTYVAAAKFGDPLEAAASGKVTPAAADAAPGTIVGKCTAPAGVAAGAVGLMRLV